MLRADGADALPSDAVALPAAFTALKWCRGFESLPDAFYRRVLPTPLPAPQRLALSASCLRTLGLDAALFDEPLATEAFAGNIVLPGSTPLSAVYAGHQFGAWAGQLGDGRAHLLGTLTSPQGPLEIQLKGSGPTPFSRHGDGRAVLRSSIREFLCSEAMAALGIPTTRALCLIGSPLLVRRERAESAAVVTRVAPSFVRFGSFEHWAVRGRVRELRRLADHIIDDFRPELRDAQTPYEALLTDITRRSASLVAHWQAIGFMHGVLNTDNMSILGLTLDYGPFGFMEAYDPGHICNHSDSWGRYAYDQQPAIVHWNLYALGQALLPLIESPELTQAAIEDHYWPHFKTVYDDLMRRKLGLSTARKDDPELVATLLGLMASDHADHPRVFRALCNVPSVSVRPVEAPAPGTGEQAFLDEFIDRPAAAAWLARWRARLASEPQPDELRQSCMRSINPRYVLRNWVAEEAIEAAERGDLTALGTLMQCLEHPFDDQPHHARWAEPPPDWAAHLSVSCSS